MKRAFSLLLGIASIVLVLSFPGCRQGRSLVTEQITGQVLFEGKPLENAYVQFLPKTVGVGEAAGGYTDAQGFYKISSLNGNPGAGAVQGEYFVTVSKMADVKLPKPVFSPARGEMVATEQRESLPVKYLSVETTPFSATVKKGKNVFDWKIE